MPDTPFSQPEDADSPPLARLGWLTVVLGNAAAWLFVLAVAISTYEVAMRYLFSRPSNWAHVSVTTLCAIGFAIGGAYAMARNEHIRISVLVDRMRGPAQRACMIFGLLVGALYLAGLSWGFWILASESILRFGAAGQWQPELTPGPPNWPLPSLGKGVLLAMTVLFLALVLERVVTVLRRKD